MQKVIPLMFMLLMGLVNEANSSELELKSELFLKSSTQKGSLYATVCFITDTEDCNGNKFKFEKPEKPELCRPLPSETDCEYGTELADDGCKGTRYVCKACEPLPSETNCKYGTETKTDGCGGTRTICKSCTPMEDETNCKYGTTIVDDGCGGKRKVCKSCVAGGSDSCKGSSTPCASDMIQEVCMDCSGAIKYNCFDPEDEEKVCPQKVYCDPNTKIGVEPSCKDSTGKLFYEKCLAKEICTSESVTDGNKKVSLAGKNIFQLDTTGVDTKALEAQQCAVMSFIRDKNIDEETVKEKCGLDYYKEKCTNQLGETYHFYTLCYPGYQSADGVPSRCYGYKECQSYAIDKTAKTCTCGGKVFYERCLEETCKKNELTQSNGGKCNSGTKIYSGEYEVNEKCTTLNNEKVLNRWYCSSTVKDCEGNLPPCSGYYYCDNYVGGGRGKTCTCGGETYYESCVSGALCSDNIQENGGKCIVFKYKYSGYYEVKATCNGFVAYGNCNSTSKDCEGNFPPCSGMVECYNGEIGVGEPCKCEGKTYYEKCEPKPKVCEKSYNTVSGDDPIFTSGGEYKVKEYCTTDEGTTYYYHASCIQKEKDSAGNNAPCAGYQECKAGYIAAGKTCTCGGKTYHEACTVQCDWEDTEESCRIKGKGFSKKCYGVRSNNDITWYGECI